jgi:cysteine desulfurase
MPTLSYYDAAATTPTHPLVVEAMLPYFTEIYGNPSSNHEFGKRARVAVETAREQVAELLKVQPDEVIFTSGATEAVNLAIFGYWMANRECGNHIITVVTEHAAVLKSCENLEQFGVELTKLTVNRYGQISYDELRAAFRPDTLLVSVMHVNNETGLIHNVQEIAEICAERGVAYFTDATQAPGHVDVDYSTPEISMAAISGHKFQGPKGIGALVRKRGVLLSPILHGGGQEEGLRPGSLPTPLIVGLGLISSLNASAMSFLTRNLQSKSETIETTLISKYKFERVLPSTLRSPHIIPLLASEDNTNQIFSQINTEDRFIFSTGSACNSGSITPSHVLTEMLDQSAAKRFMRFSLSSMV